MPSKYRGGGRFYALFVDFEKAFDRVDRSALWHKLSSQNVSFKMVRMLKAIYEDVKTCNKSPMGLTDCLTCPLGVRQGCIISPIMFTLFLNDMKDFISLDSYGVDIETIKLFVLLFADGLVIFAETVIELQRMINRLGEYCNIWRLTVNLLKTKVIADLCEIMSTGNLARKFLMLLLIINISVYCFHLETLGLWPKGHWQTRLLMHCLQLNLS